MKTMLSFGLQLTLLAAPLWATSRPRTRVRPAKGIAKPCASSLADCPSEGCGGDPKLNVKKNRTKLPAEPIEEFTYEDFMHLEEERPTVWQSGQNRTDVEELGEDTPVALMGYMIGAHPGSPETCNCKLRGLEENDFHINIVERATDRMRDSIVVEMTPRIRANNPKWTIDRLTGLLDPNSPPFVKVTGYLLFDSEHVSRSGGPRATIWQVHPITKFEVCRSTLGKCEAGQGWVSLDQID